MEVGRREPYESPMPFWEVRGGTVVRARESRVHQDEDEGEGPQPLGTNRTKGTSERASCTWVDSYGAEEMRRNAPGIARRLTKGESRMR